MDHIAIILVHYNTETDTKECLESILRIKSDQFTWSVVLVDNGSTTPLKLPKTLQSKKLELLRSESNLGYTGGNNLGISFATKQYQSAYFWIINNDTVVHPRALIELHRQYLNDARTGIAVSKIYFYKNREYHSKSYSRSQQGKVLWYGGGSFDWQHLVAFHRHVDEIDRGQADAVTDVDFATGCSMLIKREVFESIGILDKRYFLYLEDVDFSFRALKHGLKVVYVPKSLIWHKNAGSSDGAGSRVQQYYQTRNRLYFSIKYGSLTTKIIAIRLAVHKLTSGTSSEKHAVKDLILQRMGKQPIM